MVRRCFIFKDSVEDDLSVESSMMYWHVLIFTGRLMSQLVLYILLGTKRPKFSCYAEEACLLSKWQKCMDTFTA